MTDNSFLSAIDRNQESIIALADTIWDNPETAFREFKSSEAITSFLTERGFTVAKGVAGLPTAFIASFGNGHPEIGFIAEFDALPGISQQAMVPTQKRLEGVVNGHGCGHHLYAGDAVAAALAVQEYLRQSGNFSVAQAKRAAAARPTWLAKVSSNLLTPLSAAIQNASGPCAHARLSPAATSSTNLTVAHPTRAQSRISGEAPLMPLSS